MQTDFEFEKEYQQALATMESLRNSEESVVQKFWHAVQRENENATTEEALHALLIFIANMVDKDSF